MEIIRKLLKPLYQFEPCDNCGGFCYGKCRKPTPPNSDDMPQ